MIFLNMVTCNPILACSPILAFAAEQPGLNNKEKLILPKLRSYNRMNLEKTADTVLLSMFMRTNGKCNDSHAP